jgi:hypothetical protein
MPPAIVIPAYNRPAALKRLLNSLQVADYSEPSVPLIISVDPESIGPNQVVLKVAESFEWKHGPKRIQVHAKHLGLLQNFYFCGNLTTEYESVIILEDDLWVSPSFYKYATQALSYYEDDASIGGLSLYCYRHNGFTHESFIPLVDGTDIFFAQIGSILGQVWSRNQWENFASWRSAQYDVRPVSADRIHDLWLTFDEDDYFPIVTKYLISTERYFLFPRVSLTTGFGDAGTHFSASTSYFQVPLQGGDPLYRFQHLHTSNCVYDSFMEIVPDCLKRLTPELKDLDFEVDLNATKKLDHFRSTYVFSTRVCENPIRSYALTMYPPEANLVFGVEGSGISLCRLNDLRWDRWGELQTRLKLQAYHLSGRNSGLKRSLKNFLLNLANRIRG